MIVSSLYGLLYGEECEQSPGPPGSSRGSAWARADSEQQHQHLQSHIVTVLTIILLTPK